MAKNFTKPIAAENEILKASDVTYGYDALVDNIMVAMRSILSGGENSFVVGGKVKPFASGGLNVSITPIFAYEKGSGKCVAETGKIEPVSFEEADSTLDRIDIVEVGIKEEEFDVQTRAMNDPSTGTKTYVEMATKKRVVPEMRVKKGSNGSPHAPQVDEGFVKVAEVVIPAGILNIDENHIKNITARKGDEENVGWTANLNASFNPGYLAEIYYNFLVSHNEEGKHKERTIDAKAIDFGVETGKVKGSLIPSGQSMSIHNQNFTSQTDITMLLSVLAENMNEIYPLANSVLGRFSPLGDIPVACSTENINIVIGGEKTIDGIACTVGQMVFLKDQTNPVENGFWEVQTGAWNRYEGYTATDGNPFIDKLVAVENGIENAGRIFYLEDNAAEIGKDALRFKLTFLSASPRGNTAVMRDSEGRVSTSEPKNPKDAANKKYVDKTVDDVIRRNSNTGGVGIPFGGERFIVFDFSDENHKSVKIKQAHIALHIKDGEVSETRWLDVATEMKIDLAEKIQAAADASSSRQGQINGRDFYLYLVPNEGDGVEVVVSTNSTFPNDISAEYTANNTRKIGQFHTLCADAGNYGDGLYAKLACISGEENVGDKHLVKQYVDNDEFYDFYNKEIKAVATGTQYGVVTCVHPLDGFLAGDILPESVWCLTFHPKCNGGGMVYDVDTDMAIDIYLQSGKGKGTASIYGGTTTDTRQHQNHQDDMRCVGKRLLYDHEFSSAALGSNECTAVQGANDKVTTGGWNDSAGRRMVSAIGCEDMCGFLWQWLENISANGGSDFSNYDGQAAFGKTYGASYALLAGGYWNSGSSCGSRCRHGDYARSAANAHIGGRGASRVLRNM